MAINEYKWQEATHEKLLDVARYFQNMLNLRDWEIILDTNNDAPKELAEYQDNYDVHGATRVWSDYLKAIVWIPLDRTSIKDENPYLTLAHEMLHVLTIGVMGIDRETENISYHLQEPLYKLLCTEKNIKIAEIK